MGLSGEQRARILQARQTLLNQMGDILQRRREIIQSLQVACVPCDGPARSTCLPVHAQLWRVRDHVQSMLVPVFPVCGCIAPCILCT